MTEMGLTLEPLVQYDCPAVKECSPLLMFLFQLGCKMIKIIKKM